MGKDVITDIIERLTRIEAKLEDGLIEEVRENRKRIRNLEKFWWMALGILGTLQLVAPFLWEVLRRILWR